MKKLKTENINNILFLDIETAPNWLTLEEAPQQIAVEWVQKFKYRDGAPAKPDPENNPNEGDAYFKSKYYGYFAHLWTKSAGLYPEFSRIVCISVGFLNNGALRIKSYSDKNEIELLNSFTKDLKAFQEVNKFAKLCAHYGKGFDFPYIAKRLLIHRQQIPFILDTYGLKPWEMESLIDTHEVWKMGGFGNSAGLSSLAMALGIPSPKDDIDGGDVSSCYHNGEIERIVEYCEKDIITLVNVFKGMRGEELLKENQIITINK